MSMFAPKNTLRHQLARLLCSKRDMTRVEAKSTARAVSELVKQYNSHGKAKPEAMALQFYLLQHAMSDVRQRFGVDEPMGNVTEIVELHHEKGVELSQRMFSYLLLICTREARHAVFSSAAHESVTKTYGHKFVSFLSEIRGTGSDTAVNYFLEAPPDMELGTYCAGLAWTFYNTKFGSGYGGEAWGKIADLLSWFVNGDVSAEMMLDTAFTLAHNGGPIFNKGMCFKMYDSHKLRLVLDVQASGQIPQLIDSCQDYELAAEATTIDSRNLLYKCKAVLGEDFGGQIDWFKVTLVPQAAGSYVYTALKSMQVDKYGCPEWVEGEEKKQAELAAENKKKMEDAAAKELAKKKELKKLYSAEHFTVGIGNPLAKEQRNGE